MATLRRALYAAAAIWFLSGLAVATAPHFWLVTVFDQIGYSDFAYVRFAGTEGIALALLMVMVANHLEDNWWWSWAFVIATGAMAIVAIVNVAAGLPHGSSSGVWWLVVAVTAVVVPGRR